MSNLSQFILSFCICWIARTEGKVFQSVQHTQLTDTEVLVSWVLEPGQTLSWDYRVSYTYRLAQIGDCQPVLRSKEISIPVGPGMTSLTLFNLQPWRTYQYKLKAPSTYFKEEEIAMGVFSTRPTLVPKSTVTDVKVYNVTRTTVDITWREPPCRERNGPLRRFDVQLVGPDDRMVLNAYAGLYVTISNLLPATQYLVRVRYVSTVGASVFTDAVQFTTASDAAPSEPGEAVDTADVEPNGTAGVEIPTAAAESPADSEDEGARQKGEGRGGRGGGRGGRGEGGRGGRGGGGEGPQGTLDLPVAKTMSHGSAPAPVLPTAVATIPRMSRSTCGTVQTPCAPYDLKQVDKTLNCVDISWRISDPLYLITAFDVFDCSTNPDVNVLSKPQTSPPRSARRAKLCGLQPGMYYTFGIRSRTVGNNHSAIVTIRVHTDHRAPPKPLTPKLRAVSKSTIQVEISSVASNMGPVTSYYIIVGSVALSEQERVDAGIASSPAGYWKGKPVLTSGYRLASSATMLLQEEKAKSDNLREKSDKNIGSHTAAESKDGDLVPPAGATLSGKAAKWGEDGRVDLTLRAQLTNRVKNSAGLSRLPSDPAEELGGQNGGDKDTGRHQDRGQGMQRQQNAGTSKYGKLDQTAEGEETATPARNGEEERTGAEPEAEAFKEAEPAEGTTGKETQTGRGPAEEDPGENSETGPTVPPKGSSSLLLTARLPQARPTKGSSSLQLTARLPQARRSQLNETDENRADRVEKAGRPFLIVRRVVTPANYSVAELLTGGAESPPSPQQRPNTLAHPRRHGDSSRARAGQVDVVAGTPGQLSARWGGDGAGRRGRVFVKPTLTLKKSGIPARVSGNVRTLALSAEKARLPLQKGGKQTIGLGRTRNEYLTGDRVPEAVSKGTGVLPLAQGPLRISVKKTAVLSDPEQTSSERKYPPIRGNSNADLKISAHDERGGNPSNANERKGQSLEDGSGVRLRVSLTTSAKRPDKSPANPSQKSAVILRQPTYISTSGENTAQSPDQPPAKASQKPTETRNKPAYSSNGVDAAQSLVGSSANPSGREWDEVKKQPTHLSTNGSGRAHSPDQQPAPSSGKATETEKEPTELPVSGDGGEAGASQDVQPSSQRGEAAFLAERSGSPEVGTAALKGHVHVPVTPQRELQGTVANARGDVSVGASQEAAHTQGGVSTVGPSDFRPDDSPDTASSAGAESKARTVSDNAGQVQKVGSSARKVSSTSGGAGSRRKQVSASKGEARIMGTDVSNLEQPLGVTAEGDSSQLNKGMGPTLSNESGQAETSTDAEAYKPVDHASRGSSGRKSPKARTHQNSDDKPPDIVTESKLSGNATNFFTSNAGTIGSGETPPFSASTGKGARSNSTKNTGSADDGNAPTPTTTRAKVQGNPPLQTPSDTGTAPASKGPSMTGGSVNSTRWKESESTARGTSAARPAPGPVRQAERAASNSRAPFNASVAKTTPSNTWEHSAEKKSPEAEASATATFSESSAVGKKEEQVDVSNAAENRAHIRGTNRRKWVAGVQAQHRQHTPISATHANQSLAGGERTRRPAGPSAIEGVAKRGPPPTEAADTGTGSDAASEGRDLNREPPAPLPLRAAPLPLRAGEGREGMRRKRDTTLPPGQIVAELSPILMQPKQVRFVVGDGQTYSGFRNSPLSPEGRYNVYLVANSQVEKVLFSVSDPLVVSMPLEPSEARSVIGRRRNNYVVMGVMISFAVIVMAVMIWLKCMQYDLQSHTSVACSCCRFAVPDRFFSTDELGMPDPSGPGPLASQRLIGDSNSNADERHWTQTYSLSEPRSIVTGRELLPPPQGEIPAPSPDRPVGSEPITFRKEFQSLPRPNPANSTQAGRRHRDLNNTPHVLPYDATRVILDHDGTGGGDYVNASHITGYMDDNGKRSSYIAAQCPFDEATAMDTWRMIYQQAVPTVVVLNRIIEDGSLRCLQFWPDMGKVERGPFILHALDQFTYAHYTELLVAVKKRKRKKEELLVRIFCFTSWPEKGVPQDAIPLVELCTRVHKSHRSNSSPILVMCETGSGRTAVFIAVDILLAQYATENQASVYDVVCAMRSERPCMVQTFPQYTLVYDCVLEEMHAGDTWVSEDLRERYTELNRHNPNTGHTYLRDQFILLETMLSKDSYVHAEGSPQKPGGPLTGNVPDVIPAKRLTFGVPQNRNFSSNIDHLPTDDQDDGDDEDSTTELDNVVFVDGYRRKNQFIMTQTPLPSTVSEFWQRVYENDVRSIVVMEEPDPSKAAGQSRGEYWPTGGSRLWEPFLVELLECGCEECITVRTFRLVHMHRTRDEPRMVRQFQFHGWSPPDPFKYIPALRSTVSRPPSHNSLVHADSYTSGRGLKRAQCCPPLVAKTTLLSLHSMVKQWQHHASVDSTPILVHCRDGAFCSGLYVALALIAARMDEENLVSVYRICRGLRKQCFNAISNVDQYKFLYKALWDYINLPPSKGTHQERTWSPLQSPEMEYRGKPYEESGDDPDDARNRVFNNGQDSEGYEMIELTETEEEQTEDSAIRVTDYYNITTNRPSPARQLPQSSQSSSGYDDNYRFTPHELYPKLTDRPPRQEQWGGGGGGGGQWSGSRYSPRKTPTPTASPSSQRGSRLPSPTRRGGDLPAAPRSTPPRTPTRNQLRSSPLQLSRTPSPVPRRRPHSLSPIGVSHVDSSPRRRRRQSFAGRMETARRSPARASAPGSPTVRVRSENVVQETTEVIDRHGVVYRQEVTDTVRGLSVSSPSDSDY